MADLPGGLWPQFENLFLDHYIPNFWSLDDIDLAYGRVMVIDPDDMPSMLWRGDLTQIDSYNQVLEDIKNIETDKNIPIGFCFSSSWKGNIESFQKHVSENGFHRKMSFHWLTKDLVRARINFLRKNNIEYITTAVFEKNNKSMKVQLNAGYKPLEITEYWMQA
jgi:hypothetical protein